MIITKIKINIIWIFMFFSSCFFSQINPLMDSLYEKKLIKNKLEFTLNSIFIIPTKNTQQSYYFLRYNYGAIAIDDHTKFKYYFTGAVSTKIMYQRDTKQNISYIIGLGYMQLNMKFRYYSDIHYYTPNNQLSQYFNFEGYGDLTSKEHAFLIFTGLNSKLTNKISIINDLNFYIRLVTTYTTDQINFYDQKNVHRINTYRSDFINNKFIETQPNGEYVFHSEHIIFYEINKIHLNLGIGFDVFYNSSYKHYVFPKTTLKFHLCQKSK